MEEQAITSADVGVLGVGRKLWGKPAGTATIFCANCQKDTVHALELGHNPHEHKELLASCPCGRQLKFPPCETTEELKAHFDAHAKSNRGQRPASSVTIADDDPTLIAIRGL